MTYEKALEWCENHVPQMQFESFKDWFDACENELQTPALFESERFQQMMRDSWDATSGEREEREKLIREIQEREAEEITTEPVTEPAVQTPSPQTFNVQVDIRSGEPVSVSLPSEPKTVIPIERIEREPEPTPEPERVLPPTGKAPELPKPIVGETRLQRLARRLRRVLGLR